jgi:hypothetical protein
MVKALREFGFDLPELSPELFFTEKPDCSYGSAANGAGLPSSGNKL